MHHDSGFQSDERFSPAEQRKILNLAARLQHRDVVGATQVELEVAAQEAGIEPFYVREAIRISRRSIQTPKDQLNTPIVRMICFVFLLSQMLALFVMINDQWKYGFGAQGQHLWAAFILSFAMGSIFSGRKRAAWIGFAAIGASTLLLGGLIGLILRLATGETGSDWPRWFANFLLIESGLYLAGHGLGKLVSKINEWSSTSKGHHEPL